jgi:pilus assembly protein Flp/PilA
MNNMLIKLNMKLQDLMNNEEGQDLVEYALVISLVAVGAVAALGTLTTDIVSVFTKIDSSL